MKHNPINQSLPFLKIVLLLGCLIILGVATPANAETVQKKVHRLALVIGNQAYAGKPWRPLVSPVKDAEDIWDILSEAGFDSNSEHLVLDGNGRKLRTAVEDFGLKVRQVRRDILKRNAQDTEAMVVTVFFSGHGFMVNDTAYLAGTDAVGKFIEDITDQSVPLNQLVRDLTPGDRDVDFLSILFVDACRSNVQLPSRVGLKNKGTPLTVRNPFRQIQGIGRISVFATTDGKPSFDGRSNKENSVFTEAIIEAASKPQAPASFSEFVGRIEKNTPKVAKARFNVEQWPEIYRTGVTSDFFWTAEAGVAASKAADLSNVKGSSFTSVGWVWIGDYGTPAGQENKTWLAPRFVPTDGRERPSPGSIAIGDELMIQANLNVRDAFPVKDAACDKSKKYQECAKLVGTIPKGLKIKVLDHPKSVGNQNWVKAEFDSSSLYR
jgi:hypothetical protein